RIGGVRQGGEDRGGGRCPPLELPDAPAALAAESQSQVIDDQVAEDRVGGTELVELVEHQLDHPARLFVRLLNDLARGGLEISQGDGQKQLAARRLVPTAPQQAIAHGHQLKFCHDDLHSQKQTVVTVQRIVDAIEIAQEW